MSIDQGTTGTTVLILDSKAKVVGRSYSEFKQYYPQPGWVEHDAEEIWKVTSKCMRGALKAAKIQSKDLASIGITNQRETVVLWDKETGEPIHKAIVWQCRRTAEACEALKDKGYEKLFRKKTGLVLDPYFSGTKIAWILDQVKGSRTKARRGKILAGTIDTWLIWKLTGGESHVTDPTNASRTLLFNIETLSWDPELSKILNVPDKILPEVKPSSGHFGIATEGLGKGAEVPITGVAGDQQAALFGQACWEPGMTKNTYGTGCFMLMHTGTKLRRSRNGLLTTVACGPDGSPAYALEGSVFIAGAAMQWLRDELKILSDAPASEKVAKSVPDTGGVYLVPAFVGLGAPYWDPDARGALIGLTRGTAREHVVRAALESMAYQTKDLLDAMQKDAKLELAELRVDGGASANDFLMQFQAGILQAKVDRPKMIETTALGAAFLAGLAVGFWKDANSVARARKRDKLFAPKMNPGEAACLYAGWENAVSRVRSPKKKR